MDRIKRVKAPATGTKKIPVFFAPRRHAILSAEISARVLKITQDIGASFFRGDVLIAMEDERYDLALERTSVIARAARERLATLERLARDRTRDKKSAAILKAAQAKLTATRALYRDQTASTQDLEIANRDVIVAKADHDLSRASTELDLQNARKDAAQSDAALKLARRNLAACKIHAPYDGRIVKVMVQEYEYAQPNQKLIEIVDDKVLRARFLLPAIIFRRVKLGMKIKVHVNEVQQTINATITNISAGMDPASNTFQVYAEVPNPTRALRFGMTGWVRLNDFPATPPTAGATKSGKPARTKAEALPPRVSTKQAR